MEYFDSIDPSLLALLSAATFAAAQIFYRQALRRLSPSTVTFLVNAVIGAGGLVAYLASEGVARWPLMGVFWFALVGVLGPFIGRYVSYRSIISIGLARTQVLAQTSPIWSAALAVFVLGERLSPGVVLGTLGILAGAVLLVRERGEAQTSAPLRLYFFPLLAALIFAVTPTVRKLGFAYIPSAPFGIMVSMNVGVGLHLIGQRLAAEKRFGGWDRRSVLMAVAGGGLNFGAAMCFWTAVKVGDVVSVVPITRLSVLFVVLFSWLFLRRVERVTWRVAVGAVLAVAGVLLIAGAR